MLKDRKRISMKKKGNLTDKEIADGFRRLGLQDAYREPYDPDRQYSRFKRCTIYDESIPCYATGNSRMAGEIRG